MSVSLTSSPRAFKESVCPAASESKKSCLSQLGFRQRLKVVGVANLLRADLLRSTTKIRLSKTTTLGRPSSFYRGRFILSAEAGGFLARGV